MNAGLCLGLLQCGVTVWAAQWYARYAGTALDPLGADVRRAFEQPEGGR
ncbi:hypothetical protein [Streptomyces sp. NBC_01361]|nr:hypothetical protein [Streptomyces sp. NBC_01361]